MFLEEKHMMPGLPLVKIKISHFNILCRLTAAPGQRAAGRPVLLPLAHHVRHLFVVKEAPLLLAQHLVHRVALRRLPEPDLGLDQLQDLSRSGTGVKLHRVEPSVHEVEPGVDGAPVDSAEDLLLARRPLPPPRTQRLVEASLRKSGVLSLLSHEVGRAFLEMSKQVFSDNFIHREND